MNMTNLEIMESFGAEVRKKVNLMFPTEKNVNYLLKKIIERLGGKIIGTDEPVYTTKIDGSLHIKSMEDFIIKLPLFSSPLRDNFTLAHELAHYLIHYSGIGTATYTRYGEDAKEIEANRFAASFLMPRDEFLKAREELNDSIGLLAARFQVPMDIVKDRMEYVHA